MELELLSRFQMFAVLIGLAGSHTFMPIILYQAWKSHKTGTPFDFSAFRCWAFSAFILSCISTIIMFVCVTIPIFLNSIVTFFELF